MVAPVRERGLKYLNTIIKRAVVIVAPVRERGLKFSDNSPLQIKPLVAPVRERGLKSVASITFLEPITSLP